MEKRIEFTGVDNGLGSMISKIKSESKQLGSDLIADARRYSDSQKEQVRYLEDQIKALKQKSDLEKNMQLAAAKSRLELSKSKFGESSPEFGKAQSQFNTTSQEINKSIELEQMQVGLLRELIDTIKLTAKEEIAEGRDKVLDQIKEFDRRVASGEAVDPLEAFKIGQQKENLGVGSKGGSQESVFTSMLATNLINRMAGIVKGFPNAKNELDMITPGFTLGGAASGGIIGNLIDMAKNTKIAGTGLGDTQFGVLGTEIGAQLGEMVGEAMTRNMRLQSELFTSEGGLRGLSGGRISVGNNSNFGIDNIQTTQLAIEVAKAVGTSSGLRKNTADELILEKAFGLDKENILGQFRSSRTTGDTDVFSTVQNFFDSLVRNGILSEDDRVLFGEMLKNQQELIGVFGSETENVSSAGVQKLMQNFDKVGGIFSSKSPRQLGAIQGVNDGLRNPTNDYAQAMNYQVLRRIANKKGIDTNPWELQKMQAGGLETEGYLQGAFDEVNQYGGSDWVKKTNLKKYFPNLNHDAIERIFAAGEKGDLADIDRQGVQELVGSGKRSKAIREAEGNVSQIDKSTAEITNSFTKSMGDGVFTVSEKFTSLMLDSVGITAESFKEEMDKAIKDIINKTPTEKERKEKLTQARKSYVPVNLPGSL